MNISSISSILPQSNLMPLKGNGKLHQISFERIPAADVLEFMESQIQQAAKRGIDMPVGKKAVRKFSTDELKMLEMQIEEGNTLKELAQIYKVSDIDMRSILLKNGKIIEQGEIISKDSAKNIEAALNTGRYSSMSEISKKMGADL